MECGCGCVCTINISLGYIYKCKIMLVKTIHISHQKLEVNICRLCHE